MTDPKQQQQEQQENQKRMPREQKITQERPSHMNQGNQTFRPDLEKKQEEQSGRQAS